MSTSKLQDSEFPGLFQAADIDSFKAQKYYFRTLGWFLYLLLISSIFNLFSDISPIPNLIAAILLIGSLSLSGLLAWKRFDRTWYSARDVAESVKTRTWRFMMRCEPYNLKDKDDEDVFLTDLNEILKHNSDVTKELCDESASRDAISNGMRDIRALSVAERLAFYVEHRVSEQGDWYHGKASFNKGAGGRWFIYVIGLNLLAIVCALVRIQYSEWNYLPTEVLTVGAVSAVSWLQAKRFTELATSYALTSHEINLIRARSPAVTTESDLSEYVSDTENAFSREHTQWAARRDTVTQN